MANQTKTRRASSAPQGRFARGAATSRSQGMRRRRQPQPTGLKKVLGGMLPAGAAKKAAPSSKKGAAGGFALIAAAAGMAFKNRGKLSQMRHKDTGTSTDPGGTFVPPATNDANRNPAV